MFLPNQVGTLLTDGDRLVEDFGDLREWHARLAINEDVLAARQIGSALGIAMAGTVLASSLASKLPEALMSQGLMSSEQADLLTNITSDSAGSAIPGTSYVVGPEITRILENGFSDATAIVLFVSTGILIVGFIASLLLTRSLKTNLATQAG